MLVRDDEAERLYEVALKARTSGTSRSTSPGLVAAAPPKHSVRSAPPGAALPRLTTSASCALRPQASCPDGLADLSGLARLVIDRPLAARIDYRQAGSLLLSLTWSALHGASF